MSDSKQNLENLPETVPFYIRKFMGHTITLRDDLAWNVDGPEFDGKYLVCDSFRAACQEVEKRVNEARQLEMQNLKFSARVVNSNGHIIEIDRINRRSNVITGFAGVGEHIYPNTIQVRALIARTAELRTAWLEADDLLKRLQIKTNRGYGTLEVANYPRAILQLKNEIEAKTRLADELLNPKPETETEGGPEAEPKSDSSS
jgi:hypothetical protein